MLPLSACHLWELPALQPSISETIRGQHAPVAPELAVHAQGGCADGECGQLGLVRLPLPAENQRPFRSLRASVQISILCKHSISRGDWLSNAQLACACPGVLRKRPA